MQITLGNSESFRVALAGREMVPTRPPFGRRFTIASRGMDHKRYSIRDHPSVNSWTL